MADEELHTLARDLAADLAEPDRKQLRFNDIVRAAKAFYANPRHGIRDLIQSCEKSDPAYVKGKPMWDTLEREYQWMQAA